MVHIFPPRKISDQIKVLHYAAEYGLNNDNASGPLAFGALLDLGVDVDVNAVTRAGETVLHLLLQKETTDTSFAMLSKLVERKKLDPNFADPLGRSPLFLAAKNSKRWLSVVKDAAVARVCGDGLVFLRELLGACPAAALAQNCAHGANSTPLHVHALRQPWTSTSTAAAEPDPEVEEAARAFVAVSDLLTLDAAGRTPLHIAAKAAGVGPLLRAMLESPKAAAALCTQDTLGATPLQVGCRLGRADVVDALLEATYRTGRRRPWRCATPGRGR
eukprot:tig00000227_g19793.t1